MDLTNKLETNRQLCRVCLQKGDINIWDFKVQLSADETNYISNSQCKNSSTEESPSDVNSETFINALQLLEIFNKTTDSLVLPNEFPFLCWQCLEDFRLCYIFYAKVNNSNMQLQTMYDEYLGQCIEEEHLSEASDLAKVQLNEIPEDLDLEDVKPLNLMPVIDIPTEILPAVKSPDVQKSKRLTLDKNSFIVVAQFVPTAIEPPLKLTNSTTSLGGDEETQPFLNLHTVDYTTVEIRDVNQLASLETTKVEVHDTSIANPPVYVCQYCPQAFAKSEFLKTHVQRNHVCKFCMESFEHYNELCQHLRQHNVHKCVICEKILSSTTNLRHHIKRVHRITLPPKITLLDFAQSKDDDDDTAECLLPNTLPEMLINDISGQEEGEGYDENPLGDIIHFKTYDTELINGDELKII